MPVFREKAEIAYFNAFKDTVHTWTYSFFQTKISDIKSTIFVDAFSEDF